MSSLSGLSIRTGGLTTQGFSWLAKQHRLTEGEVRDLDARYKAADLDRSGSLDKNELKVLLKHTIAVKTSDDGLNRFIASQWHNVDRDGNGTVDFDEFLSLYSVFKRVQKTPAKTLAKGAVAADATKDGAAAPAKDAAAKPAAAKPAGDKVAKAPAAGKSATGKGKSRKAKKPAEPKEGAKPNRKSRRLAKYGPKKDKATGALKVEAPLKKRRQRRTFKPAAALTAQNYVTPEVAWSAIRNHHSFLKKRNGVVLSGEPGNLRNVHSRFSTGLTSKKTVNLSLIKKDGVVLSLRRNRYNNKPSNSLRSVTYKKDNKTVARQLLAQLKGYRRGLVGAALARMTRLRATSKAGVKKRTARKNKASGKPTATKTATTPAAQATQTTTAQ